MIYKYKMQWMFNYETAKKVLPIIGAQSLDNIRVRDARNLRIWEQYNDMIMYWADVATEKAIERMDKMHTSNSVYFEFVRK